MKREVLAVINSELFKDRLNQINANYSNIKQESLIRNAILESLNNYFASNNTHYRAFAEHPRNNGFRIDLSIINGNSPQNPYCIEFKFQFSGDFKEFLGYQKTIDYDFHREILGKKTDLFILIIQEWDSKEKIEFDNKWGITSNLSRYQSVNQSWKTNITTLLTKYCKDVALYSLEVCLPYKTTYHFYIIERDEC